MVGFLYTPALCSQYRIYQSRTNGRLGSRRTGQFKAYEKRLKAYEKQFAKQQKAVRNFEPTNIKGGTNISEGVQRFQVVSEIFVPGGPDISGVQIFRDSSNTIRINTRRDILGMRGLCALTIQCVCVISA